MHGHTSLCVIVTGDIVEHNPHGDIVDSSYEIW